MGAKSKRSQHSTLIQETIAKLSQNASNNDEINVH